MGGKTTTTHQTEEQQQQQQQSQTGLGIQHGMTTPNMPEWYENFLKTIPGQYGGLQQQLQGMIGRPLYGPQQQAQFQQGLGQQLSSAQQGINEMLAKRGVLNSALAGQTATNLQLGGAKQLGDYLSQVPGLNAQYQQSLLGQAGNLLANAQNFKIPIGQTTDQTNLQDMLSNMFGSSSSTMDETQKQSGGLLGSILGGLLGTGLSALTGGLGGLLGGGGFGAGAASALQNVNPTPASASGPSYPQSRFMNAGASSPIYPWQLGGAGAPPPTFGASAPWQYPF